MQQHQGLGFQGHARNIFNKSYRGLETFSVSRESQPLGWQRLRIRIWWAFVSNRRRNWISSRFRHVGGEFFIRASSIRIGYLSTRLFFLRWSIECRRDQNRIRRMEGRARFFPGEQLRMSYRFPVIGYESSKEKTISHASNQIARDCAATFIIEIFRGSRRRVNRRQYLTSSCYEKHESWEWKK